MSNFYEILILYRQGGVDFLGVFQNAAAQIEAKYGRETARIWKKALAHTLYRGLPDTDTLKEIEHRSGKTSVMVRGFNVNNNQVNGSGDNLSEQARPLLQVEDIRAATGGESGLLEFRDHGYFNVDVPNFWEREEMSDFLSDVREKPDKYSWLTAIIEQQSNCVLVLPMIYFLKSMGASWLGTLGIIGQTLLSCGLMIPQLIVVFQQKQLFGWSYIRETMS